MAANAASEDEIQQRTTTANNGEQRQALHLSGIQLTGVDLMENHLEHIPHPKDF